MSKTPRTEAREALGYVDGAMVDYATLTPRSPRLPVVHIAYRPVTPNRKQELLKRRDANLVESSRMAVDLVATHVKAWDLADADGRPVALDKRTIGDHVRDSIVEGVFELIMEDAFDERAEQALREFPDGGQVSV